MQTEDAEKLNAGAVKFLDSSQELAYKIGALAKSEGVSSSVFMFSLLACVAAAEEIDPATFRAVREFYDKVTDDDLNETKKERGN